MTTAEMLNAPHLVSAASKVLQAAERGAKLTSLSVTELLSVCALLANRSNANDEAGALVARVSEKARGEA